MTSAKSRRLSAELGDEATRSRAVREIAIECRHAGGNAVQTARRLGVSHRALCTWMRLYDELRYAVQTIRQDEIRYAADAVRKGFGHKPKPAKDAE